MTENVLEDKKNFKLQKNFQLEYSACGNFDDLDFLHPSRFIIKILCKKKNSNIWSNANK